MKKWLNEVVLETDNVKLLPICENHKDDLITASLDGNLSELWFASIPTKYNIDIYIAKAIEDFKQDKGLAFVVINKKINRKNDCFNRGLPCFAPYPADFLPAALSGFCLKHPGFR